MKTLKTILMCLLLLVFVLPVSAQESGQIEGRPFAFSLFDEEANVHLVLADLDGNYQVLMRSDQVESNKDFYFKWSADHSRLFVVNGYTDELSLYSSQGELLATYAQPYEIDHVVWVGDSNEEVVFDTNMGEARQSVVQGYNFETEELFTVVNNSSMSVLNSGPQVSPDGQYLIFEHEEWSYNCYIVKAEYDRSLFPYPRVDVYNHQVDSAYELIEAGSYTGGCHGVSGFWVDSETVWVGDHLAHGLKTIDVEEGVARGQQYLNQCLMTTVEFLSSEVVACSGSRVVDLYRPVVGETILDPWVELNLIQDMSYSDFALSSDESMVLFGGSFRSDQSWGIYVMPLDGSEGWRLEIAGLSVSIGNVNEIEW